MSFKTSAAGRAMIEKYEGLRLRAYQDIVGVWTIGYGCTGAGIGPGLVWTKDQADQALSDRLADEFEPAVNRECEGVPTTQGQFDALVSLAYNIGAGGEERSTVVQLHRAGKYDDAADAFLRYDHAGGREVEALTARRAEEGQLYLDSSPDEAGDASAAVAPAAAASPASAAAAAPIAPAAGLVGPALDFVKSVL